MKPTFQTASGDLRQTSILHSLLLIHFVTFSASPSFNSDLRAVEFFIRDKYEKKKYYSKNVTNGSSVCTSD